MKKFLTVLLTIVLIIINCVTPLQMNIVNAATTNDLTFKLNSDGNSYSVVACSSNAKGELVIPKEYDNKPVTSIGERAFSYCTSLTSVTVPESVSVIGYCAFVGCTSLEIVNYNAIDCVQKRVSGGMASIVVEPFEGCKNLTTINIGESVTSISGFGGCASLTSINIPESVTWIGGFNDCTSLTSIDIPESVTWIHGFNGCTSLTSVTIPENIAVFSGFNSCTGLETVNYNAIAPMPYDNVRSFQNCSKLKNINIGEKVTYINLGIFSGSTSLTSVTIPESVNEINAFDDCTSLTSVTIPESVTWIGGFNGCTSLTSIDIPEGVTSLSGFSGCTSLTSVTIPESVTSLHGFRDCTSLTSVTIPEGVTSLSAFSGCTGLETVNFNATDCGLGYSFPFNGCTNLSTIKIGQGVTLASYIFSECTNLTSLIIPYKVVISDSAFEGCTNLSDIWYSGRNKQEMEAWIGDFNDCLYEAKWHYNTCINNHVYVSDCDFSCNKCEWIRSVSTEHRYDNACDIKCNDCGVGRIAPHTYDNACDTICNGCEAERIAPHIYDSDCDIQCNDCLTTRVTTSEHQHDNQCDTVCNFCGQERTVPHNYEWVIDKQNNCGVDGEKHEECTICHITRNEDTKIEATNNHTYDNACDTICNVCRQERTVPHNYEWVIDKQNNCGVDGEKHEECTICHITRNENTKIEATNNHTYDNACDTICNVCSQERTVPDHSYTLNGNHTCDICKYSRKSDKPVIEMKTNSSVTLVRTEGFEYSKDGISWQTSNTFTGLLANTTYTFYQRVKKSTVALVSDISEGAQVTFKSTQSSPSAPIVLSFTDTTVTLMTITNGEYSKDGTTWQTSNVFIGLSSGTQYTFYQRYAETEVYEYSNKSIGTNATTEKSKQTLIPNAPTVESITSSSITLVAVSGCEYSKNGTKWQTSNVFTGLSCGTEYTFYQRYKETYSTYAGKSSEGMCAKTDKGLQSAPSKPTLSSKNHNSVILVQRSGYEYSMDSVNWQTSSVFTGLNPETNYMFYQRKAETDRYYASASSTSLTVKTNEEPQYITGDFNNDEAVTDADALYLLYHTIFGDSYPVEQDCDYNNDGSVTDADALYLLYHTIFGNTYPLN